MDGGEEVAPGLVVAGGNGAKLLEFGEEVLDQMSRHVEVSVVIAGHPAIGLGRDDSCLAGSGERRDDPLVSIKRLVRDQRVSLHRGQEVVGADQIMSLSAGQKEVDRVAERIEQGVDLGAQSTTRSPDRLVLAGFFW